MLFRSIIGGKIGVMIIKKRLNIKKNQGNLFAAPVSMGIAIGRIGCFLRGCCYGIETTLPWGINFGDGVLRHPTQIYESIFCLGLSIYFKRAKNPEPGQLFKEFLLYYFTFRFLVEFIRFGSKLFLGLTGFQFVSLGVILYVLWPKIIRFLN